MEQTLRITSVLADPTRYYIYQYIIKNRQDVTVQEIADSFEIHPNVARLHLSKLEDVNMLVSETKKTGKGGRPSRLYRLSNNVIQLHFPTRDYQLLAKIALQAMVDLGEHSKEALFKTGKSFGKELIVQQLIQHSVNVEQLSFEDKVKILNDAAKIAGFSPDVHINKTEQKILLRIFNCPFKELAINDANTICSMHDAFLTGMLEALFTEAELSTTEESIVSGCDMCSYQVNIKT